MDDLINVVSRGKVTNAVAKPLRNGYSAVCDKFCSLPHESRSKSFVREFTESVDRYLGGEVQKVQGLWGIEDKVVYPQKVNATRLAQAMLAAAQEVL